MAKNTKATSKNKNVPDIIPEEITIKIPARLPQFARENIYMNLIRAQSANARVLELSSEAGQAFSDLTLQVDRSGTSCKRQVWRNPAKGFRMTKAIQDFIVSVQDQFSELCKEFDYENREPESVKKIRANRFTEETPEPKVAKGA